MPDSLACLVISAPRLVYQGPGGKPERTWGVFCPLHALGRASGLGAGDFSDLEALADWVGSLGGGVVATLPLLATSFADPGRVSPYSPASRLFWNEFHVDPERATELTGCEAARAVLGSAEFRREAEAIRSEPLVDYARQMGLKRRVLELLADAAGEDSPEARRFLRDNPEADAYARFMASVERGGPLGEFRDGDPVDERARRYHLYAQRLADDQLRAFAERAGRAGVGWCVDNPVGVDARGFDVWRWGDLFAEGVTIGCPPDEDFTLAQDWAFPPLHPERHGESGYAYGIAALRHQLRHAGAVRVDHLVGMHRLYWLPEGGGPDRLGAYVAQPAEELYAILSVETHRRGAWVVGEDLGTIPPEVPESMRRHGLRGLYVVEHEMKKAGPGRPLAPIAGATVASVDTHDLPPFAAFWEGRDIAERAELGLLDAKAAAEEKKSRPALREALVDGLRGEGLLGEDERPAAVLLALEEFLAGSPAAAVLVNLEDLWLETEPQNVPGTGPERPNWRRKLRFRLEEFARRPEVADVLRRVDGRRRDAGRSA